MENGHISVITCIFSGLKILFPLCFLLLQTRSGFLCSTWCGAQRNGDGGSSSSTAKFLPKCGSVSQGTCGCTHVQGASVVRAQTEIHFLSPDNNTQMLSCNVASFTSCQMNCFSLMPTPLWVAFLLVQIRT